VKSRLNPSDSWRTNPFEITELGLEVGTFSRCASGRRRVHYVSMARKEQHPFFDPARTMREGIEDYQLLHALGARNPEQASRLAEKVIPAFTGYVPDARSFRKLYAELLAASSR
jgi:hypothetical protein